MCLGSFGKINFVDHTILAEMDSCPKRRQVVNTLLIEKFGQHICLSLPEGAKKDGRLNLSPPQGGIGSGETLADATIRELREELGVQIASPVVYVGSVIRQLDDGHKQVDTYSEYHHHFVAVFSGSHRLSLEPSIAEAGWHHFSNLEGVARFSMSEDKAAMTLAAVDELLRMTGRVIPLRKNTLDQAVAA